MKTGVVSFFVAVLGILVLWSQVGQSSRQRQGGPPGQISAGRIVAHVNGIPITEGEYLAALRMVPEERAGVFATAVGRKAVVEQIARMRLLAEEARKRGIDKDPEVEGRRSVASDRILAIEGMEALLAERRRTDLRSYYEANIDRYTQVHARQIILGYDAGRLKPREGSRSVEETDSMAKDLRSRLRNGADFEDLVRRYSDDPTAENGGDTGVIAKSKISGPLMEVMFTLDVGGIGEPVTTNYGVHVLQVLDRSVLSFEEVEAEVEQQSFQDRAKQIEDELLARAEIDFDEEYFKTLPGL